jgi:hypothetical protein
MGLPPGFRTISQAAESATGLQRPAPIVSVPVETSVAEDVASMLPAAGGIIGSLVGGIPGAALGGAGGEALRQVSNRILGVKAPETSMAAAMGVFKEGALQAFYEVGGAAVAKAAGKLVAPFAKRARLPAVAETIRIAKDKGIELTPAQALDSPVLRVIEFAGTLTSKGREIAGIKRFRAYEAAESAIRKTLDEISPATTPLSAGQAVRNAVHVVNDNFHQAANKLYSEVSEKAGEAAVVDLSSVKRIAQSIRAQASGAKKALPGSMRESRELASMLNDFEDPAINKALSAYKDSSGKIDPKIEARIMEAYGGGAAPVLSFADAQALRSRWLQIARESGKTDAVVFAKRAASALDVEMASAAQKMGGDVLDSWRSANEFYKGGKKLMETATYRALLTKDPDQLVRSIRPGYATDLKEVKAAVVGFAKDEAAWDSFRRQWVQDQLKLPEGALDEIRNMPKILQSWKRSPEFVKEMFGDARGQKVLQNMEDVSKVVTALGERSRIAGLEHLAEGHKIIQIAGAISSVKIGAATVAARALLLPAALTKVMHSRAATAYLVEGFYQVPKNTGKAVSNMVRAFDIALKGVDILEGD